LLHYDRKNRITCTRIGSLLNYTTIIHESNVRRRYRPLRVGEMCSPEYKPSRKNHLERVRWNMNAVRLARIIITAAHPYARGELELRPEVQPTAVNAMTICRFTGYILFYIYFYICDIIRFPIDHGSSQQQLINNVPRARVYNLLPRSKCCLHCSKLNRMPAHVCVVKYRHRCRILTASSHLKITK